MAQQQTQIDWLTMDLSNTNRDNGNNACRPTCTLLQPLYTLGGVLLGVAFGRLARFLEATVFMPAGVNVMRSVAGVRGAAGVDRSGWDGVAVVEEDVVEETDGVLEDRRGGSGGRGCGRSGGGRLEDGRPRSAGRRGLRAAPLLRGRDEAAHPGRPGHASRACPGTGREGGADAVAGDDRLCGGEGAVAAARSGRCPCGCRAR